MIFDLDEAIRTGATIGLHSGITKVFWRDYQVLTGDARGVLQNGIFRGGTLEQQGARQALVDLGLIEKRWFGLSHRISDTGREALAKARASA